MALNTYTLPAVGIAFASGKSLLGIFNPSASGKIVKVWRIWILNNQTVAVTGVITSLEIRRVSNLVVGSGAVITPVKHDTTSPSLNASVWTGGTATDSSVLRQLYWSNDEPSVSGSSQDEWEMLVPMNLIWDAGYSESSNVQPLTCQAGEGVHLKHSGSSAVGIVDVYFEVTEE